MSARHRERDGRIPFLFELTKRELQPIVEEIAGEAMVSFDAAPDPAAHKTHFGIHAETVSALFKYTSQSGPARSVTVIAKRNYKAGRTEAHHCRYLIARGAPVARTYGAVTDGERREVIFVEYLKRVPDSTHAFLNDAEDFRDFLALAAQLNSVRPSGEYARGLKRSDPAAVLQTWTAKELGNIWAASCRGDLGGELQELSSESENTLRRLPRLAESLAETVPHIKVGFVHGDFFPHHTGRRVSSGQMVAFDFEDTGLAPWCSDVARWLGPPDDLLARCASREELADAYLEEYVHNGGEPVATSRLLDETRALWLTDALLAPGWWYHIFRITDEGRVREQCRKELHACLRDLVYSSTRTASTPWC